MKMHINIRPARYRGPMESDKLVGNFKEVQMKIREIKERQYELIGQMIEITSKEKSSKKENLAKKIEILKGGAIHV